MSSKLKFNIQNDDERERNAIIQNVIHQSKLGFYGENYMFVKQKTFPIRRKRPNNFLTPDDVIKIKKLNSLGESRKKISQILDLSYTTICRVINKRD